MYKVLIVEDESAIRNLIKRTMAGAGSSTHPSGIRRRSVRMARNEMKLLDKIACRCAVDLGAGICSFKTGLSCPIQLISQHESL